MITTATPYRGLMPYVESDAAFFFGREREIRLVVANLYASPLTLFYGASGVGKSSVLSAGVLPLLRRRPDLLVVAFNSWQGDPASELTRTVMDCARRVHPEAESEIISLFSQPSLSISQLLTQCAMKLERRLMIILDQFEEYFLYHPRNDAFGDEFPRMVNASEGQVSFLISTREDALGKLDRFEGRIPGLFDNYLRIEHLGRDAAEEAIVKPIERYNELAANEEPFTADEGLVDAVLKQVQTGEVMLGESGWGKGPNVQTESRIETPFLQMVMTRLWQEAVKSGSRRLNVSMLDALGGAQRIVRTHLDQVMDALSPREQEAAARIFRYLVTPSGSKIAYTVSDLAGLTALDAAEVNGVLERLSFGEVRIVRPIEGGADQHATKYEIFHDVLAIAVLDWRSRHVIVRSQMEAAESAAETARQRLQQQRLRSLRMALLIASVFMIIMMGVTVYALKQRVQARANLQQATASERSATEARYRAESEEQRANEQASLAGRRSEELSKSLAKEKKAKDKAEAETKRANDQTQLAATRAVAAGQARNQAEEARLKADEQRRLAEERAREARIASANLLALQAKDLKDAFPQRSLLLALESLRLGEAWGEPSVAASQEALRQALANVGGRVISGYNDPPQNAVSSTDNRWLATASRSAVQLLDLTATPRLGPRTLPGAVGPIVISGDSRWLITGVNDQDDRVSLWNLADPALKPIVLRGGAFPLDKMIISPDSRWLVIAAKDGWVELWDLKARDLASARPFRLRGHTTRLKNLVISPDSHWLVTHNQSSSSLVGGTARLWNLRDSDPSVRPHDLAMPRSLAGREHPISALTFSPDGHWLATGGGFCFLQRVKPETTILLWDLTGSDLSTPVPLRADDGPPAALTFSADSQLLATASGLVSACDVGVETVRIWDMKTKQSASSFSDSYGAIFTVYFSPDNNLLMAAAQTQDRVRITTEIWNLRSERDRTFINSVLPDNGPPLPLNIAAERVVAVSPDRHWLAIRGEKNAVNVIDLTAKEPSATTRVLRGHEASITAISFRPDSKRVITTSDDSSVRLWELDTVADIANPITVDSDDASPIVSSNGRWLTVAGSQSGSLKLWSLTGAEPFGAPIVLPGLPGEEPSFYAVAFSPDGHRLVTGGWDETPRLWDLQNLSAAPRVFAGHRGFVSAIAVSGNNHWLATGSHDGKVRLWDLRKTDPKAEPIVLGDQPEQIYSVEISSNSRWLLSWGKDRNSHLWDLSVTPPKAIELGDVRDMALSRNDEWLVVATFDRLRLWNLNETGTPPRELHGGAPVAFSPTGRWLATSDQTDIGGGYTGTDVYLWDLRASELKPAIFPGNQSLENFVLSPDEHWLVVNSYNRATFKKAVRMLNLTELSAAPIRLNGESIRAEAVSADSHWLITNGSLITIGEAVEAARLWDLTAKDITATPITLPALSASGFFFTPDNHWLVSRGPALWNMRLDELKALACRAAGRNLSEQNEWKIYFPGQEYRRTCNDLPARR